MDIHPRARNLFSDMSYIGPIKKALSCLEIDVDLSNNTNPFLGHMAEYPDVLQTNLKKNYCNTISQINLPMDLHNTSGISPGNILFTVGSCEGIDLLLRAFAEPNQDQILVMDPSFPAYEHWGLIHNLKVKKIPLLGENYTRLSVPDILKEKSAMLFLCNPNNPTSTVLDLDILEELCTSYQGLLVVDEAYIEFSDVPSLIHQINRFKNLVVLRTLSKAWGLAAARCGAVIAHPSVINTLRYVQIPFGFCSPSQEIVRERCDHPDLMFESWKKIREERDFLIQKLSDNSSVERILPSHANFIFVIFKDLEKTMAKLQENKIFVVDCSRHIRNGLRVTIGTREENEKFLTCMEGRGLKTEKSLLG